jgi:enoyl-CoA hydratase
VPLVDVDLHASTAVLTLNDPEHRNVLSRDMVASIVDAVDAIEAEPGIRAVVVAGRGKAFCAGAELDTLLSAADGDFAPVTDVYEAFLRLRRCVLLTVSAVDGPAVGAGFNLALATDLRVAGPGARFESRFTRLRLHPGGGHLWMLQRAVGVESTIAAAVLGAAWGPDEALRRGLVSEVADDPVAAAITMLEPLADLSAAYLQRLVASARRTVELDTFESALALETEAQQWSTTQPEFVAGVTAMREAVSGR